MKTYQKALVITIATVILALLWFSCKRSDVTVIPEEQVTNENVIQNELKVNKQNAKEIVTQIKEIQRGERTPVASYIEVSDNPVEAVKEKLEAKDTTLPPEALKETDKTIVTTNGTKVDVYKVNTYRNWELGVGAGRYDSENYVVTSIQRNYDRCHSVQAEIFVNEKGVRGGNIQWKVHF